MKLTELLKEEASKEDIINDIVHTILSYGDDYLPDGHSMIDAFGKNPEREEFRDEAERAVASFIEAEGEDPEDTILSLEQFTMLHSNTDDVIEKLMDEIDNGYAEMYSSLTGDEGDDEDDDE